MSCELLCAAWYGELDSELDNTAQENEAASETDSEVVLLREVIAAQLPEIFDRYIAVPGGWCD